MYLKDILAKIAQKVGTLLSLVYSNILLLLSQKETLVHEKLYS
jgi:hypothetical protein